jgi:hypothetical protein
MDQIQLAAFRDELEKIAISAKKVREVAEATSQKAFDWVHRQPTGNSSWGKHPSFRQNLRRVEEDLTDRSFRHTKRGLDLGNTTQAEKHHALAEGLWKHFPPQSDFK